MSDIINNISQFISEKAEKVSRKTDEVLAIQGLKGQIRTTKREIDKHYYDLGKSIYDKYIQGEDVNSEDKAHCVDIDRLLKLVAQYEDDIAAYKNKGDEFATMWDDDECYDDIVEEVDVEVVGEETEE